MARKPTVTVNPVANRYSSDHERIVEFVNDKGIGGLISFRTLEDGTLRVEVYRCDPEVRVFAPQHTAR